jgi:hypothetical protein
MNCGICYDEEMTNYVACINNHVYCIDCIDRVVDNAINRGVFVRCAEPFCESIIDQFKICQIIDEKRAEKYEKMVQAINMAMMKDTKYCVNCDFVFLSDDGDKDFYCINCDKNYCIDCREDAHPGNQCVNLQEIFVEVDNLTKANFLVCSCGVTIDKVDGCNHMTCSVCSRHWCWQCKGPWHPTGNVYNCSVSPGNATRVSDEQIREFGERIRERRQNQFKHKNHDKIRKNTIMANELQMREAIEYRKITKQRDDQLKNLQSKIATMLNQVDNYKANYNKLFDHGAHQIKQIKSLMNDLLKKQIESEDQLKLLVDKRSYELDSLKNDAIMNIIPKTIDKDNIPVIDEKICNEITEHIDKIIVASNRYIDEKINTRDVIITNYSRILNDKLKYISNIDQYILKERERYSHINNMMEELRVFEKELEDQFNYQIEVEIKHERREKLKKEKATEFSRKAARANEDDKFMRAMSNYRKTIISKFDVNENVFNSLINELNEQIQYSKTELNDEEFFKMKVKMILLINNLRKKMEQNEENVSKKPVLTKIDPDIMNNNDNHKCFKHACYNGHIGIIQSFIHKASEHILVGGIESATIANRIDVLLLILRHMNYILPERDFMSCYKYIIKKDYEDMAIALRPHLHKILSFNNLDYMLKCDKAYNNKYEIYIMEAMIIRGI